MSHGCRWAVDLPLLGPLRQTPSGRAGPRQRHLTPMLPLLEMTVDLEKLLTAGDLI
jgi:hypothetical protein